MNRLTQWLIAAALMSLPAWSWALPNEFVQEGLITDAQGRALDGEHQIVMRLYSTAVGGAPLWTEAHPNVLLFDGYYAVSLGSVEPLLPSLFSRDNLYLSVAIDGGPELSPRTSIVKVPAAFSADVARNVTGDITPNSVTINNRPVINVNGEWVGDPTGLVRPRAKPVRPAETAARTPPRRSSPSLYRSTARAAGSRPTRWMAWTPRASCAPIRTRAPRAA